ncbi:POK9 protein, partial [Promerops cafer]|nr:POK9 protein [Promerops cafer]
LQPATSGSLGLDLAAAVDTTLMTTSPVKIATRVRGPVTIQGRTIGALLIRRSSATIMGLFVLPGVTDADYHGEICIIAQTPFPPVTIQQGQRIAQLVPLPQLTRGMKPEQTESRAERRFRSTGGLVLLTLDLNSRPKKTVKIKYQGKEQTLTGLLHTRADSSIIAPNFWPCHWPLHPATATVTRVGGVTLASRTPPLSVTLDGKCLSASFSVVQLPPTVQCLIGRDILTQMGVVL